MIRKTSTITSYLRGDAATILAKLQRQKQIADQYARTLDDLAARFDNQEDQQIALEISMTIAVSLEALFTKESRRDISPKTATTRASPTLTYAETLKNKTTTTRTPQAKGRFPKPLLTSRVDRRVLVTLPSTSLMQREDSYVLRRKLINTLPKSVGAKVDDVVPIRTGWAIRFTDITTRDAALVPENKEIIMEALHGSSVALAESWATYAVQGVPSGFYGISGPGEYLSVNDTLVAEEVLIQTGETLVRCHVSKNGIDPLTNTATWIISFKTTVPLFRLFGASRMASIIPPKHRNTRDANGCQGWCNPLRCRRGNLCSHCGQPVGSRHMGPSGSECPNSAKCAHCHGPHEASHEGCPAAPRFKEGVLTRPSPDQLRSIRQACRKIT